MQTTKLNSESILPLTCSRSGTCCHGKLIFINPWELACLAKAKKISQKEFSNTYCDDGGIRLRFDGKVGWKNQPACSLYVDNFGCSAHLGRPLACRLFPLGRQIQNHQTHYMHYGKEFPCLEGCPEVTELPSLTVGDYLQGQKAELFETAQDEYLELMQYLADIAFELLLDSGLAESGDKKTLSLWKTMSNEPPEAIASRIGNDWLNCLITPIVIEDNPIHFCAKHKELLQLKIQEEFGSIQSNQEIHKASVLMMGITLHLARAIGANPKALAEHWIATAKQHGAH